MMMVSDFRIGEMVAPDWRTVDRGARREANRCALVAEGIGTGWYVAQVVAGMELSVMTALRAYGVNVWVPTRKERRASHRRSGTGGRGRMVDVEVPAFMGYVFVRTAPSAAAWHGLVSFDGVLAILGRQADGVPLVMSDKAMGALVAMIDKKVLDFSTGKYQFEPGQAVRFSVGPFQGFQGFVEASYAGAGIVPVLVETMGRETLVMVAVDGLEKCD